MNRKVGAFGQILANQPIGVFVGTTLPRSVRVCKVNCQIQIRCDSFVQCHLFSAIIGKRSAQNVWHIFHLAHEALVHRWRLGIIKLHKNNVARCALDECADG